MGMNSVILVNHDLVRLYTKSSRTMGEDLNQILTNGSHSLHRSGAFTYIGSGDSYTESLYLTNGNTGERLTTSSKVDDTTLQKMRIILETNGYKVSKTRKKTKN